ncbi:hypothetical protein LI148_03035 [Colidextribacter sp. 210702-DFI.3.9]|nr:hypothetical protein [Colidextribacter sp. 210702-DFI.3.9]MCG4470184.1 hypothetical protein [Lawsonibacter sp. DFI.6.74]MCG4773626.1 hypothetical protein [Lawsonibacter sp. DFI.5.51]
MDKNDHSGLSGLLDVDLDAIETAGKAAGAQNKRRLLLGGSIAAILLVLSALVGFVALNAQHNANYQSALADMAGGNYAAAAETFRALGTYKDSAAQLENAEFAQEFTASDIYAKWEDSTDTFIDTCLANGYSDGSHHYDAAQRAAVICVTQSAEMDAGIDLDDLSPDLLAAWVNLTESYNTMTETTYSVFSEAGYDAASMVELTDSQGNLLYSSCNGAAEFTSVDTARAKAAAYEELYQKITSLVDAGEYQQACDYCAANSVNDFYELDYKDLADYYYYAQALSGYSETNAFYLSDYLSALQAITPGFKDVSSRITSVQPGIESLNGTYSLAMPDSSILEYRITINGDFISIDMWRTDKNRSTWNFMQHSSSRRIPWHMANGAPQYAEVNCSAWIFKLTPVSDGLNVEVTTTTNGSRDPEMSGTYLKR